MELVEMRVRSRVPEAELKQKVGKIITEKDYNVLLTGPTKVTLPNGKPLIVYLPNALKGAQFDKTYNILHEVREITDNRKLASGAPSYKRQKRHRGKRVMSSLIGSVDPMGQSPYCRTTAWTGKHTEQFSECYPVFNMIADLFKRYVPERYANQMERAKATAPEWMVGSTPYTTMTVNNTYPTGVHKDAGDLDTGFSCLAVWRRGQYSGGNLTFPEYRISVDMKDGDLMLMDAHQWHGNTELTLHSEDAERISLVLYYRTKMMACGTLEEEAEKERKAKRKVFKTGEEMDQEAMKEFVTTT
tara:strand:- start:6147 stop:7049 length:903 start_codon:yes stop_codon:yes gene_type:complete